MEELKHYRFGEFWNLLLSGVAMAIVVAVTPGAIVAPFIGGLAKHSAFWLAIDTATNMATYFVPAMAAVLAAGQFKFTMIEKASVALAAVAGSGAVKRSGDTWTLVGMGDLINTILVIAVAIVVIFLIRRYVGSFAIIIDPIVCASAVGALGIWSYTYVHMVSVAIGNVLNSFTVLQPMLMCTLLAMSFSIIIATPLSTVGLAYAIGLAGIAGGAASVGVTACFIMVAVATYAANGTGVSLAMFFGGVKMMLANFLKRPRMMFPLALVGALTGFTDSFLAIRCGAQYAGFGQPVGPINSYSYMSGPAITNIVVLALIYYILPFIYSLVIYLVLRRFPKLYDKDDWKIDVMQ